MTTRNLSIIIALQLFTILPAAAAGNKAAPTPLPAKTQEPPEPDFSAEAAYWLPQVSGLDQTLAYVRNGAESDYHVDKYSSRFALEYGRGGALLLKAGWKDLRASLHRLSISASRSRTLTNGIIEADFDPYYWNAQGPSDRVSAKGELDLLYLELGQRFPIARSRKGQVYFFGGIGLLDYRSKKSWRYSWLGELHGNDGNYYHVDTAHKSKAAMLGPAAGLGYERGQFLLPRLSFTGYLGLAMLAGDNSAARKEQWSDDDPSFQENMSVSEKTFETMPAFQLALQLGYRGPWDIGFNLGFSALSFSRLENYLRSVDDTSWQIMNDRRDVTLGGFTLGASKRF